MTWFHPADDLSDKAEAELKSLADLGSSEAAAVADCLNTIAENGDYQAEDKYLVGCAGEIRDYAQRFIKEVRPGKFGLLVEKRYINEKNDDRTTVTGTLYTDEPYEPYADMEERKLSSLDNRVVWNRSPQLDDDWAYEDWSFSWRTVPVEYILALEDGTWITEQIDVPLAPDDEGLLLEFAQVVFVPMERYRKAVQWSIYHIGHPEDD